MQAAHAGPPRVVLVVEDDHDARVVMRELLEGDGYTVVSCANGQAAIELLDGGVVRPHLILLDMRLPVMDGWEVLDALRARAPLQPIPVVVHSSEEDRTMPDGVSFVLQKPVDPVALLTVVRMHVP